MRIGFQTKYLKKRFPLAISRGIIDGSTNLFVSVSANGVTGWGEMAPGSMTGADSAEAGEQALSAFFTPDIASKSIVEIEAAAREADVPASALAALDVALWDRLAKQAKLPLFKLLGLSNRGVPTSVTLGINPAEVIRERVPLLLDGSGIRSLKVKLGSPEGIEADQAMFEAVLHSIKPYPVALRVDANGGWGLAEAKQMMRWLADRGVEYIEQPLAQGDEGYLPELFKSRALPIFVDESCHIASDIPAWANAVDGVNLKLMKCGGITEALRIVATARAFGLQTMIGCMGESSISISAGAAIGALFDHIDLDSHLNLAPDPAAGVPLIDGSLVPTDNYGHGAALKLPQE